MTPMSEADGWQPISKPERRAGADSFTVPPFVRLARTHALSVAGDAMIVLALADSIFFTMPDDGARGRVFLYLALTMAPYALVAPLIGPMLDRMRGGRRGMVIGANAVRVLICYMMIGHLDSLLLFPEAFAVLVLGRGYGVARSALVPTTVRTDDELVRANSRLQLISGIAGAAAAVPAGIAMLIANLVGADRSQGPLVVAMITFAVATWAALQLPSTQVSTEPPDDAERAELRAASIFLAASAMGLVRGIVGFLTFLLAFELRDGSTWAFPVVLGFTVAGGLAGAAVAPVLRRSTSEERMLMLVLGLTVVTGLATAWIGGLVGAAVIGAGVAIVSTSAKLAFDSIVQRDAPDANRGRSFARFETRFQGIWVIGAIIPVVIPLPARVGFLAIAGVATFALFSYMAGQQAAARSRAGRVPAGPSVPTDPRLAGEPETADPTVTQPRPAAPDPVTPDPVTPDPVTPDPVTLDEPDEERPPVDPTQLQ
jgi:hypothetical protein